MSSYKYLILDMGNVLVGSPTGEWLITPTFLKYVEKDKIDIDKYKDVKKEIQYIIDRKAETLSEEYDIFMEFYTKLISGMGLDINEEQIKDIVDDFVFNKNDDKYYLFDDVVKELDRLSNKYTLILLSDNWPCAIEYLKEKNLYNYFKKVYISSVYGVRKSDVKLFDYPINDFNIKSGEAIFVDDNSELLEIAEDKNLDVILMDRYNEVTDSRFNIIHDLTEIV